MVRSAMLVSHAFHSAFGEAKSIISPRVLARKMGADVMPEAFAVIEAAHIPKTTFKSTQTFLGQYLGSQKPAPSLDKETMGLVYVIREANVD